MKKLCRPAAGIISFMLALSILFIPSVPAMATEVGNNFIGVYVDINYDDGITFEDDDIFIITYTNEDGQVDEIEAVATECVGYKAFELPEGSYTVDDIKYVGSNSSITNTTYGINNSFVSEEGGGNLSLAVGDDTVQILTTDYGEEGVIAIDASGEYVRAYKNNTEEDSSTDEETEESSSDEADDAELSSASSESSYTGTENNSGEDPVVEYYDEETSNNSARSVGLQLLRKLSIFGCVTLAGIIVLLLLHKMEII